jgi:ABC-type transport system involved in cytochrome bd biosynthesis fused ATPase/permease subunit
MKDGKIVEDGSHDELLSKENGVYANLWNIQQGGFLKDEGEQDTEEQNKETV